jgi:hypothetical protein
MANPYYLYANNAQSSLLSNIGPTDPTITLPNGEGARFPNPAAGQSFMLTIEDVNGNIEIVECTGRTVDVLTITRGREGTLARTFSAGTLIDARITAGMLGAVDWNHHNGTALGVATLDASAKLPIGQFDTPLQVYGDARWNAKLGFDPVQQGTGVGQSTNVVKLGWSAGSKLKATIDTTDQGNIAMESWVSASATALAATKLATARSIGVTGVVGGSATFDGTANCTITTAMSDGTLSIAKTSGLQAALDGKLPLGGGTISGNLYVTGTMTGGAVVDLSDAAIKEDIIGMTLVDAEHIIDGLRPVRYTNKVTGQEDFGFVVQEAVDYVPELIFPIGNIRGLSYQKLTAPIVRTLQDLRRRVADLEKH